MRAFTPSRSSPKNRHSRSRRLLVESLETRRVMTVYTPLPAADDGSDGSLRSTFIATQTNGVDDTIQLSEGTYRLRLGDLFVNEQNATLRIEGAGSDKTVLKIDGDSRAFDVDFGASLELDGVTILSGNADEGGQVRSAGIVRITDSVLQGGRAIQGGAIFNGGDLTLENVELNGNEAGLGGGIWNHAGAVIQAVDTRWLYNVASASMAASVTSHADVGIFLPAGDAPNLYGDVPLGGSALFNSGTARLQTVELAANLSDTGALIHNIGNDANLRIDDGLIHDNQTSTRNQGGRQSSVLLGILGTTTMLDTAIFGNRSNHFFGTIAQFEGVLDMHRVSIFDNVSPHSGLWLWRSNVRFENVTSINNGNTGLDMLGAPHTLFEITASAIDRVRVVPGDGQFLSGGGNRIGWGMNSHFDQVTDQGFTEDEFQDYFLSGKSFDFMQAGVYGGRVALPPTATSQLIDALPDGTDAGAFEYVAGLQREAELPSVPSAALTVAEDSGPLLLDSLHPGARDAVSAVASVALDEHGRLIYTPAPDFSGADLLFVQGPDGRLQAWTVFVSPQADPPSIDDYAITVLGRSEMLRKPRGSSELEDINAVTATFAPNFPEDVDGRPTPGVDFGSTLTERKFVADGEPSGNVDSESLEDLPFAVRGKAAENAAANAVDLTYIPEAGFAGVDKRVVRVVNSSGLSADANVTINVLDPKTVPKIGRVSTRFLDSNFEPIESVPVGQVFYVEYHIEDIRGADHPVASATRDFYSLQGNFDLSGTPLKVASHIDENGTPKAVAAGAAGGFIEIRKSPTQLDSSSLRLDVSVSTFGARSGAFYRVPVVAAAPGTITATTDWVTGSGVGMHGQVPHDWFDLPEGSIEVISNATNFDFPEDVNNDFIVSALDTLLLVNAYNTRDDHSDDDVAGDLLWDVNHDGVFSPLDILFVVNYINRNAEDAAAAEGEWQEVPGAPPIISPSSWTTEQEKERRRGWLVDEALLGGSLVDDAPL